jgi:LPS-assembly lipoprotein
MILTGRPLTLLVSSLVLTSLIGACGFHLKGATELPAEMSQTRLEVQNPYSTFARRLLILLEQNNVRVVTSADARAVLEVPVNDVRREVLTIGDNARVREYRVRHMVQFRLVDGDGRELMPMQYLEQNRIISFDEQNILASTREEEFLRDDLADILSRQVLSRLGETVSPPPGS